jgi:predicted choloylglycine hydrolase
MMKSTRREFLARSLRNAAGLAVLPLAGCASSSLSHQGAGGIPAQGYPLVEARGTHREIGRQIGTIMREAILEYFECSRDYPACREYARSNGRGLAGLLACAQRRFPDLVEELEGMAEGLDIPFTDLFAYNCRSEISMLTRAAGCSTLALCENGRVILAHNEDGDDTNVGRMFIARVMPPSGIEFISFVYPGLLPGNGPGFNSRGIVQTTNYIQPKRITGGVPRYIVGRAVLEARSLDEAVALASVEGRAFPWHHNLVSLSEGRILSVETFPGRHHVREIRGFSIHTNHLIHPEMTSGSAGRPDVPYESSLTRMRVLKNAVARCGTPSTADAMAGLLSMHEGRPYSPCRHPAGEIHGATLGMAVFEGSDPAMTLYHGNPCRRIKKHYSL